MKRLGNSALFGLICAISLVVGGVIATGMPEAFWNLPSALIIIGGTVASVIIAFPPKTLKTFIPVIKRSLIKEEYDAKEDIIILVKLAFLARREGLLALEDAVGKYTDDEFIKRGITLIVDGADEEQLRNSLEGATYFMKQRHQKGAAMVDMIATMAPALGLVGTYVGLIPMLNMLEDPTKLGPMMALELVSSFYGGFIAYVVFAPLARRLRFMSSEEESRRELLIEGLSGIQLGKNPKLIKEELYAYANIDIDAIDENEHKYGFEIKEVAS